MTAENETICINPATGQELGRVPQNTIAEVESAMARARQAQPGWASTPAKQRAKALLRMRDYIVDNADQLAATISQDNGKTLTDAVLTEVIPTSMAASYWAKKAPRQLKDRRLSPGNILLINKRAKIIREPWGVVGIISPWNYPMTIPFSEVIMALAAGNAVLLKVATQTQMVGQALARVIEAADLPEGVFSYLNLPGSQAGDAFLAAGVNKLFFTGSVRVGKELMAKAAATLTPVSLELGGNDAMLVCADANLDRAAAGAVWAGISNSGQTCGGVERIYVHQDVYQPFLEKLNQRIAALKVGADTDCNMDIGAMTTAAQVAAVQRHLSDALTRGATVAAQAPCPTGGPGLFFPPTVLTGVNHEMLVMREETFGPILAVMPVADMDRAVELANDSDLGLTGSVWSKDRKAAEALARRIQAGVITVNDHLVSHGLAETPWGGYKESGIGRTHGDIGFLEMTQPKCIVHDIMPGVKKDMWWHPYDKTVYSGLKGIGELLYARSLGRRLKGMAGLLKVFPRTFKK